MKHSEVTPDLNWPEPTNAPLHANRFENVTAVRAERCAFGWYLFWIYKGNIMWSTEIFEIDDFRFVWRWRLLYDPQRMSQGRRSCFPNLPLLSCQWATVEPSIFLRSHQHSDDPISSQRSFTCLAVLAVFPSKVCLTLLYADPETGLHMNRESLCTSQ